MFEIWFLEDGCIQGVNETLVVQSDSGEKEVHCGNVTNVVQTSVSVVYSSNSTVSKGFHAQYHFTVLGMCLYYDYSLVQ